MRNLNPSSTIRHSILISSGLLIGRLFGYCRELLLARAFGASAEADLLVLCFTLPEILGGIVASGALTYGVMKLFQHPGVTCGTAIEVATPTLRRLSYGAYAVILASGVVIYPDNPLWIALLCLAGTALLPNVYSGLATAILQSQRRFGAQGIGTVIVNITLIIGLLATNNVLALVMFALFAVWLRRIYLARCLRSGGSFAETSITGQDLAGQRRQFNRTFLPAMVGLAVIQLHPLVDRLFAAQFTTGSLALFAYAEKLALLPVNLFLTTYAVALFPALMDAHSDGAAGSLRPQFVKAVILNVALSGIVAIAMWGGSDLLVRIVFGWTKLTPIECAAVARVIRGFSGHMLFAGSAACIVSLMMATSGLRAIAVYAWSGVLLKLICGLYVVNAGLPVEWLAWASSLVMMTTTIFALIWTLKELSRAR